MIPGFCLPKSLRRGVQPAFLKWPFLETATRYSRFLEELMEELPSWRAGLRFWGVFLDSHGSWKRPFCSFGHAHASSATYRYTPKTLRTPTECKSELTRPRNQRPHSPACVPGSYFLLMKNYREKYTCSSTSALPSSSPLTSPQAPPNEVPTTGSSGVGTSARCIWRCGTSHRPGGPAATSRSPCVRFDNPRVSDLGSGRRSRSEDSKP